MEIGLVGKVMIFDEAHNIEKQIEEANSYEISLQTFKRCELYFKKLNELIQKHPEDQSLLKQEIRQLERPILSLSETFTNIKARMENKLKEKMANRNQSKEVASDIFQKCKIEVHLGRKIFDYYKDNMKGSL